MQVIKVARVARAPPHRDQGANARQERARTVNKRGAGHSKPPPELNIGALGSKVLSWLSRLNRIAIYMNCRQTVVWIRGPTLFVHLPVALQLDRRPITLPETQAWPSPHDLQEGRLQEEVRPRWTRPGYWGGHGGSALFLNQGLASQPHPHRKPTKGPELTCLRVGAGA